MIEQIGEVDSLADISALVSQRLTATMHPYSISVFYRETATSELKLRYRSGSGLEMVEPGLVVVSDWRPDRAGPLPLAEEVGIVGAVARKP